jgi:hypothetical protein
MQLKDLIEGEIYKSRDFTDHGFPRKHIVFQYKGGHPSFNKTPYIDLGGVFTMGTCLGHDENEFYYPEEEEKEQLELCLMGSRMKKPLQFSVF